jgi:hypothetical protein
MLPMHGRGSILKLVTTCVSAGTFDEIKGNVKVPPPSANGRIQPRTDDSLFETNLSGTIFWGGTVETRRISPVLGWEDGAIERKGLYGGEGGIRTPDRLTPMSDFESGAFNRALPPLRVSILSQVFELREAVRTREKNTV